MTIIIDIALIIRYLYPKIHRQFLRSRNVNLMVHIFSAHLIFHECNNHRTNRVYTSNNKYRMLTFTTVLTTTQTMLTHSPVMIPYVLQPNIGFVLCSEHQNITFPKMSINCKLQGSHSNYIPYRSLRLRQLRRLLLTRNTSQTRPQQQHYRVMFTTIIRGHWFISLPTLSNFTI